MFSIVKLRRFFLVVSEHSSVQETPQPTEQDLSDVAPVRLRGKEKPKVGIAPLGCTFFGMVLAFWPVVVIEFKMRRSVRCSNLVVNTKRLKEAYPHSSYHSTGRRWRGTTGISEP